MKLTPELACDLMITALEGGSNYWLEHHQPALSGYGNAENYTPSRKWTVTDDEGERHVVDWNAMRHALEIMPEHHLQNLKDDNWDAETADVWLQCAAFGEIVYG